MQPRSSTVQRPILRSRLSANLHGQFSASLRAPSALRHKNRPRVVCTKASVSTEDVSSNEGSDQSQSGACPYTAAKEFVQAAGAKSPAENMEWKGPTNEDGPVYPGPEGNSLQNLIDLTYIGVFGIEKSTLHFADSYGPIVRFPNFGDEAGSTFITDPDYIQHCCATNASNYTERFLPDLYGWVTDGKGIVASTGEYNRRHRKMCMPFFQKGSVLRDFSEVVVARCQHLSDIWNKEGSSIDVEIAVQMQRLTLDIIGQVAFSYDFGMLSGMEKAGASAREDEIATDGLLVNINTSLGIMGKLFITPLPVLELMSKLKLPFMVTMETAIQDMRKTVSPVIQARRQDIARGEATPNDLLDTLLTAELEAGASEATDDEIWEDVHDVMGAGHETTASVLTACLYSLTQHPEVEAKMVEEIGRVLGGRAPGFDDVEDLAYCQQVVREVLRLYPPIPVFPRVATDEDVLPTGHRVCPGELMFMSCYAMGRSAHVWDDPMTFDPDRFADMDAIHRFAWVPFGAGPRMCMGANFAMLSVTLALVTLLQNHSFQCHQPRGKVFPIAYDITMNFPGGVDMTVTGRK